MLCTKIFTHGKSLQIIGVEVVDKLGGVPMLEPLISEGDALPKKGTIVVKAGQTIKAGSDDSLNIKLWEGNIKTKIEDNRFIGVIKIKGTDFESGIIPTGTEMECEYEMTDSGTINMEVAIPAIGAVFSGKNFYSRQEGQDNLDADNIAEGGRDLSEEIDKLLERIDENTDISRAKEKARNAASIDSKSEDIEELQKANNDLLEAKRIMSNVRKDNLREFRRAELERFLEFYESVKQYAEDVEVKTINNIVRTAERDIERNDPNFDNVMSNLWNKSLSLLIRQDWFVVMQYNNITSNEKNYIDKNRYYELKEKGDKALESNDINSLRYIIGELLENQIRNGNDNNMFDVANIIKR